MSENTDNNKNSRNDEIDLLELFRRIGKTLSRWFSALLRASLISVVFILRRWIPLTISIIIGVGISYLLKTSSPSFYTSDLVLRNNIIKPENPLRKNNSATTAEMIAAINRLHEYCMEGNTLALLSALADKPEEVNIIRDISAYWIIDKGNNGVPDYVDYKGTHNIYDTTNVRMQDRFDIRVKIQSPNELSALKNHLLSYLERDSLFQQKNRLRIKQDYEMLYRVEYDISQLDSLQKFKYFEEPRNIKPKEGGQIIFMQDQKTQLLYTDIYTLYTKKQELETDLDLYSGIVTILSDFSLPAFRENSTSYYGKKVIPVLTGLTLLVLILLANRKKIREIFQNY
jgi:hypothetical protein